MNLEDFKIKLLKLDKDNRLNLSKHIDSRKIAEMVFHDLNRSLSSGEVVTGIDSEEMLSNKKFYKTTDRSRRFVNQWIKENCRNKVVLDYACGLGEFAKKALAADSEFVVGIDISPKSIDLAKKDIDPSKELNIMFIVGDAENTGLPDNSIDVILCSGMLHHLDLSYAFFEMRRVLKPGGKVIAIEALDINPFIKLYRILTPKLRTEFESKHILSLKELRFAERFFKVSNVNYWHVIGYLGAFIPILIKPLDFIDKFLEKIPVLNRLAWQFTFELVKREE